jgi:hypothetical protein
VKPLLVFSRETGQRQFSLKKAEGFRIQNHVTQISRISQIFICLTFRL